MAERHAADDGVPLGFAGLRSRFALVTIQGMRRSTADELGQQDLAPLHAGAGRAARLAAFGRAILYVVIAVISAFAVSAFLKAATHRNFIDLAQGSIAEQLLGKVLFAIALVIVPTGALLLLFNEPFSCSGWAGRRGGRLFVSGLVAGLGLLGLLLAILGGLGGWSVHLAGPHAPGLLAGLASAGLWLGVGFLEEGSDRGYLLVQLSRCVSFWPAALLTSALFLLGHVANPGESWSGIAAAGLIGLVLAYSFLRTGSLWFALGFHAAWDFAESFVFGVPNSGARPDAYLLLSDLHGPALLTGGSAGPEGSILVFPIIALLAVIVRTAIPAGEPSAADQPSRET